jgi:tetratricopeptide (TPR) repeat protein
MNEMLGNQFFLTRRFNNATTHFEKALVLNPTNNDVKKKLIICYIQQNELKLALKLFTDLITDNIETILQSDPSKDDCPCQQMISEIENSQTKLTETEKNTILGILWLYCDKLKSKSYFEKLVKQEPSKMIYQTIANIINQPIHN